MLFQARSLLLPLLTLTGPLAAIVGGKQPDEFRKVENSPGFEGEGKAVRNSASSRQQSSPDSSPCDGGQQANNPILEGFLSALDHSLTADCWADTDFQVFGMCSPGMASHLLENICQRKNCLKGLGASEVVDAVKDGELKLSLRFPRRSRPSALGPVLFLFGVDAVKGDGLRMTFKSHSLQPNTQSGCISPATRFLILNGVPGHSHIHLSVAVHSGNSEHGWNPGLHELRDVVMKVLDDGSSVNPMLIFLSNGDEQTTRGLNQQGIQPGKNVPGPITPSRTFLFLRELQTFFNHVFPQSEAANDAESPVSLDALHSLPPLSLGSSSAESLLSGLVNSSSPTLFVFPRTQQSLQTHRVQLSLESPLVSVLTTRLEEAVAQIKQQEAGADVADRIQRLRELTGLSGLKDEVSKEQKEAHYRSVLLLKALQMVLKTWEVERALRNARSGDETSGPSQCRLQSLTVSLRKFFLEPSVANINNCEGTCGFPLNNANNHAILLNSHIQSGHAVNRTLCCVPVEYDELCLIELESEGTKISYKTSVVATKCGCR